MRSASKLAESLSPVGPALVPPAAGAPKLTCRLPAARPRPPVALPPPVPAEAAWPAVPAAARGARCPAQCLLSNHAFPSTPPTGHTARPPRKARQTPQTSRATAGKTRGGPKACEGRPRLVRWRSTCQHGEGGSQSNQTPSQRPHRMCLLLHPKPHGHSIPPCRSWRRQRQRPAFREGLLIQRPLPILHTLARFAAAAGAGCLSGRLLLPSNQAQPFQGGARLRQVRGEEQQSQGAQRRMGWQLHFS